VALLSSILTVLTVLSAWLDLKQRLGNPNVQNSPVCHLLTVTIDFDVHRIPVGANSGAVLFDMLQMLALPVSFTYGLSLSLSVFQFLEVLFNDAVNIVA
jgi:hypothetical protein